MSQILHSRGQQQESNKIKMDNKALADKAKKAGYKSTQDYVNVQAVRKGGLGT